MRRRKRLVIMLFIGVVACAFIHVSLRTIKRGNKITSKYKDSADPYLINKSVAYVNNKYMDRINIKTKSKPEVHHIAFLKVHKAASSTVQNIFLRFGYKRNLSFVLPKIPSEAWPNVISITDSLNSKNIMPSPNNRSFDILCCHVLFNKESFKMYMSNDTFYIGIVRDPFEHFQSSIYYFLPKYIFNIKAKYPVSEYLNNPLRYEYKWISPKYVFTNNRMAVEYGFPEKLFVTRNQEGIDNYLKEVDKIFSLVIVVEYLDESLLLMKHILNWTIKDILYISKNAARKKLRRRPHDLHHLQEWLVLDYALYDFFHTRLWKQIAMFGSAFQKELLYFKRLRLRISDFCLMSNIADVLVIPKCKWHEQFTMDHRECRMILHDELSFLERIRRRQYNITQKYRYSNRKHVQMYYEKNEAVINSTL